MASNVTTEALEMLKPEHQLGHIKIDCAGKVINHALTIKTSIPYKCNIGGAPIVHLKDAGLALCGSKGNNSRGICVRAWERNGIKGEFATLKLAVNRTDHGNLAALCGGILDKFATLKDPMTKSMWWQTKFPGLDNDGTKVFKQTEGFTNLTEFCFMESSNDRFNSPASTFGKFLYAASDDDAKWYMDISLPREKEGEESTERLVLYDEKGKMIGNRHDSQGNEVYSKGGILLSNKKKLKDLMESTFFQDSRWKCDTFVQIYAFQIKHDKDLGLMYPIFKMSVFGDIKFQVNTMKQDPNQLTRDQVSSMFASALYDGVSAPSRKKRKVSKPKKVVVKQGRIEAESISGSDVEGDEEE